MTDMPATSRVPFIGEITAYTGTHQLACTPGTISGAGMIFFPPASARPGLALRLLLKMTDIGKQVVVDAVLARETFEAGRYAWEVQFVQMSSAVAGFFAQYAAGQLAPQQAVPVQPTAPGLHPSPTGPLPMLRTPTGPLPVQQRPPSGPLHRVPTGPMQRVATTPGLPRTPTRELNLPGMPRTPTRELKTPGFYASGTPQAESLTGRPVDPLTTQLGVGDVGGRRVVGPPTQASKRYAPEVDEDIEDVPESDSEARHSLRPRDLDSDQIKQYMRAGSGKLDKLFREAVEDLDRPAKK